MTIRAYAVVCANGEIHENGSEEDLTTVKRLAQDWRGFLDCVKPADPCGPHRVITLRGEVSLPRRRG